MTDFERSIKRGMDRDRFFAIRNQPYGDDKNVFRYTYGNVASWFTWNRDKNGDIVKLKHKTQSDVRNFWDGGIGAWEQGQKPEFSKKLTVDIVFLGLNLSGDGGLTFPWGDLCFQNARGVRRIAKMFAGTAAEGAYFTDIIKPDRRFLVDSVNPKKGNEIMAVVRSQSGALKEHIDLFVEELTFIGANKPLLIVFGGNAREIVQTGINTTLRKNFRDIVYTDHYSSRGYDDEYKETLKKDLARYITI